MRQALWILTVGVVMQHLYYSSLYYGLTLILSSFSLTVSAEVAPLAPVDNSPESFEKLTSEVHPETIKRLATKLPSEAPQAQMTKAESLIYLKENPAEFEILLGLLLKQGNSAALRDLLQLYRQIPNYDPSVLDWGEAVIKAKNGQLDEAITIYRRINAKLPDVKILRFQMAMALFYNRQFEAAKSEFEKLRSSTVLQEDIAVINSYLEAINEQGSWEFNGSLSYVNDSNLTNGPKQGTKLEGGNGNSVTYTSPPESGKGVDFALSGDKKWFYDNKVFTALHLNSYGHYYWDNKKFNDMTAGLGVGVGYQNVTTEVELTPFYNKRWYGGGTNGSDSLKSYADTTGVKASLGQWLSPQWRYQGLIRWAQAEYADSYRYNDGDEQLYANTLIYMPNHKQFWTLGADYLRKDAESDADSFTRKGGRVSWGQTWPKGYSTQVSLGYGERDYKGENFFGIKRENQEYSADVTLWNRDFHLMSLTPRFSWNYQKVSSNSVFEEYSKNGVSVELTKSF